MFNLKSFIDAKFYKSMVKANKKKSITQVKTASFKSH